jgi:hypothetical protein
MCVCVRACVYVCNVCVWSSCDRRVNLTPQGAMGIDTSGGWWLIHSAPKWPIDGPSYQGVPTSEQVYGQVRVCGSYSSACVNLTDIGAARSLGRAKKKQQSFFCISFENSELDKLSKQLAYNRPWFYAVTIASGLQGDLKQLYNIATNYTCARARAHDAAWVGGWVGGP